MILLQFLLGWPAIVSFVLLASAGAWKPSKKLMAFALVWSLPSSLYLFGGNGWIQLAALYIPVSLGMSVFLIDRKQTILPKILLVPIYVIYTWLGMSVLTQ